MGRALYQADIEFSLPSPEKLDMTDEKFEKWADALCDKLKTVWSWENFGSWTASDGTVCFSACGDDTTRDESAIVREAADVIWKHVGQFVEVNVSTCCLENLPTEGWGVDEDDYDEWVKKNLLDVMAVEGQSDDG